MEDNGGHNCGPVDLKLPSLDVLRFDLDKSPCEHCRNGYDPEFKHGEIGHWFQDGQLSDMEYFRECTDQVSKNIAYQLASRKYNLNGPPYYIDLCPHCKGNINRSYTCDFAHEQKWNMF